MTWGVLYVDINAERANWAYGPFLSTEAAEKHAESLWTYKLLHKSYLKPVVIEVERYPDLELIAP